MVLSGNKETLVLFSIQKLTRYKITRLLHHVYVVSGTVVFSLLAVFSVCLFCCSHVRECLVFVVLIFGSVWCLLFSYSAVFCVCCSHIRQCLVFVMLMFGNIWCLSCSCSAVLGSARSIYVHVEPISAGTGVSSLGYPGRLLVALSNALFEVDFSYSLSLLKLSWPARRLSVQWSLSRGCDVYLKLSGPARRLTTKKTRCISSDTHALICATYQGAFCVSGAVGVCVCDGVVSGPLSLLSLLWLSLLS